jgi:hypothetical protein
VNRLLALACALLCTSNLSLAEPPHASVERGMAPAEVRARAGAAQRVPRVILYRRYIEQWQYDDPAGYVDFSCPRGEKPFVLTVHWDESTSR